jgi:hypothetical protein
MASLISPGGIGLALKPAPSARFVRTRSFFFDAPSQKGSTGEGSSTYDEMNPRRFQGRLDSYSHGALGFSDAGIDTSRTGCRTTYLIAEGAINGCDIAKEIRCMRDFGVPSEFLYSEVRKRSMLSALGVTFPIRVLKDDGFLSTGGGHWLSSWHRAWARAHCKHIASAMRPIGSRLSKHYWSKSRASIPTATDT